MLTIRKSRPAEANALAEASREAFHSDVHYGAPEEGGPPGYDDPEWQRRAMRWADYYTLRYGNDIIGGMIVIAKEPGHYEVGRIYIRPAWQGRGLGAEAFEFLWHAYPLARHWSLCTPRWNARTRHFYVKRGFREIGETSDGLVLFERRMPSASGPSPA